MATSVLRLLKQSLIVFRKDFQLEFRTRYALNAIALFAVTTLTVISFSIGPTRLNSTVLAPLLWIVLFFSAISGLAHVFVREEEQQTADTLRLVVSPTAVLLGKWFFNVALLIGLEIIVLPLFFIMMNARVESLDILLAVVFFGGLALASVATIIAAIIAISGSRGALFAVLSFPIALPVLLSAIHSTQLALEGAAFIDCLDDLRVLFSFNVVIVTTAIMVFEFVWRK